MYPLSIFDCNCVKSLSISVVFALKMNTTSKACVYVFMVVQSSFSSEKKDEVHGTVYSSEGKIVQHLFGKWSEGVYSGGTCSARCIWRPG